MKTHSTFLTVPTQTYGDCRSRCPTPEPIPVDSSALSIHDWNSDNTRPLYFNKLPIELVTHIRSFIPLSYLFTHLSFCWSCQAVRRVYERDDRFWKKVCLAYGIGKPLGHPLATISWKQLAIDFGDHLTQCSEVTCCGPHTIDRHNWHRIEMAKQPYQEIFSPSDLQGVSKIIKGFSTNIKLYDGPSCNRSTCECQLGTESDMDQWLQEHTAGVCAFATEVPLNKITVDILGIFTVEVCRPGGVTVWDVMTELSQSMEDEYLTIGSLYRIFNHSTLTHLSRRFYTLTSFCLRDLLEIALPHLAVPDEALEIALQTLGNIELPLGMGLFTPMLTVFPSSWTLDQVLSALEVGFPNLSEEDWFQHLKEFKTVGSTIRTLHAKLTGIHQTESDSDSITFTTNWYMPEHYGWLQYLMKWPDDWMPSN